MNAERMRPQTNIFTPPHNRPEHVRAGDITWPTIARLTIPPRSTSGIQKRARRIGSPSKAQTRTATFAHSSPTRSLSCHVAAPGAADRSDGGQARPYSAVYAQRRVREARKAVELGPHVTLDACRHGGLTEVGNAGATEQEGMALSMHKTPQAIRLYVKRTRIQRINGFNKRRDLVEKGESGTVVGIGRQKVRRNGPAKKR